MSVFDSLVKGANSVMDFAFRNISFYAVPWVTGFLIAGLWYPPALVVAGIFAVLGICWYRAFRFFVGER